MAPSENPYTQPLRPQQGTKAGGGRKREGWAWGLQKGLPLAWHSCGHGASEGPGHVCGAPREMGLRGHRDAPRPAIQHPRPHSLRLPPSSPLHGSCPALLCFLFFAAATRPGLLAVTGGFSFPVSPLPTPPSFFLHPSLFTRPLSACFLPRSPSFFFQRLASPGPRLLSAGSPASLGPAEPPSRMGTLSQGVGPQARPTGGSAGPRPRGTRGGWPRKASNEPQVPEHTARPPTPPGALTHCRD